MKEYEDYMDRGIRSPADSNIKIVMDYSGLIIAACNLDKNVRLIDYYSGKLLGKMNVGELTTAAMFTPNGKKILTTTADGCIFVWKLSTDLSLAIRARMSSAHMPIQRSIDISTVKDEFLDNLEMPTREITNDDVKQDLISLHEEGNSMKLHESLMPAWAKSDLKPKKSPFELAKDQEKPIPGAWGKVPMKLGLEDIAPLREDPVIKDLKTVEFSYHDVDSEEEKKEEENEVIVTQMKAKKEDFTVTKSIIAPKGLKSLIEDEVKEDPEVYYDAEEDPEEIPNFEPENETPANPMRKSLSSSF